MWQHCLLLSMLVACTWQMGIKRSDDSCDWWESDCRIDLPAEAVVKTPVGECACVPFYLCKEGQIIEDGANIFDPKTIPKAKKTKSRRQAEEAPIQALCEKATYVCCGIPDGEKRPDLLPPPDLPPTPYTSVCGQRKPEGAFVRVTTFKDNEAQYGEFPWMAIILRPTPNAATGKVDDVFVCGASLVHPQVVLTTAHCVAGKDPKSFNVRVGEWDSSKKDELVGHQDIPVVDSIIHEGFNAANFHNNFALLFLATPAVLNDHIDTICLPASNQAYDPNNCIATGWGKDQFGEKGRFQQILKKIEIPIVPRDECQKLLRTTRLGPFYKLHSSTICAGGIPGRDTCKGDGGSPLVCPIPGHVNRYVQVGIVGWGIGCGDHIPGGYSDVVGFTSWIQEKIAQRLSLQSDYFAKLLPA